MKKHDSKHKNIAIYGHFNSNNFGNEATLQTILDHLRVFHPDAKVTCICSSPETTIANHQVETIPISETLFKSWVPRNRLNRVLRRVCVGLPSELFRWVLGLSKLSHTDVLIVPGTGLITDAFGLFNWGPYSLLKWSLIAKARGCKLIFISVGAGPIYGTLGRWFVKIALSLADFRSYRDHATKEYLESIGFHSDKDRVYPDLVFGLTVGMIPFEDTEKNRRRTVGLGVMKYAEKYSVAQPREGIYSAYLESLAKVVTWLSSREYNVRLLSGDLEDTQTREDFKALLSERISARDQSNVIDEPILSVDNLLSQLVATDIVVATRFHNVVLALLCGKPVISISFHQKCEALMNSMGLDEYCLDINDLEADRLIEKICDLEMKADKIRLLIRQKTKVAREALDEQYKLIFDAF